MACDSGSIQAWSSGIGLPTCIGQAFCAAYGRLPQSLSELVNWGNSSGYRNPSNGVWTCTPSSGGGGSSSGGGAGCWNSSSIGIPAWIGPAFCQAYGRPPQSISELTTWGDCTGARNPSNGVWASSPPAGFNPNACTSQPGPSQPPNPSGGGASPPSGGGSTPSQSGGPGPTPVNPTGLPSWVLPVGIAAVGILLLTR